MLNGQHSVQRAVRVSMEVLSSQGATPSQRRPESSPAWKGRQALWSASLCANASSCLCWPCERAGPSILSLARLERRWALRQMLWRQSAEDALCIYSIMWHRMSVVRISFSVHIDSVLESSFPLGVGYFKGLLLPLIIFPLGVIWFYSLGSIFLTQLMKTDSYLWRS